MALLVVYSTSGLVMVKPTSYTTQDIFDIESDRLKNVAIAELQVCSDTLNFVSNEIEKFAMSRNLHVKDLPDIDHLDDDCQNRVITDSGDTYEDLLNIQSSNLDRINELNSALALIPDMFYFEKIRNMVYEFIYLHGGNINNRNIEKEFAFYDPLDLKLYFIVQPHTDGFFVV